MTQRFKVGDLVRATEKVYCGGQKPGDLAVVVTVRHAIHDYMYYVQFLVPHGVDNGEWNVDAHEIEKVEDHDEPDI